MSDKECCPPRPGRPDARWFFLGVWSALCLALAAPVLGQQLRLEIEPEWQGKPLLLGRNLESTNVTNLSLSRLDGLLSQLALQRPDGTWLESTQWYAFISVERGRLSATADGLPAQQFKAIRFRVGLDAPTDRSSPEAWPPEHPLHPDVCGLHWGWNSGYVFLALEGHLGPHARPSGFSYHLANPASPMIVELPVALPGSHSTTIRLGFDVAQVLQDGAVLLENSSTHSRDGDTLAPVLKHRTARAFRVKDVQPDIYQPPDSPAAQKLATRLTATPYRLPISERLPRVQLPEDNPLTIEGVSLGRRLFHDVRLSKTGSQSCATCHDQARAFTDGQAYSTGDSGAAGRRNAMPLINLAWVKEFFWDGRAKSLREQVLLPIQDAHEMNEKLERVVSKLATDGSYPSDFEAAFGSPGITPDTLARALEQFLLTLVSQDSKFDRAARNLNQLTRQERRGLQLFVTEHDPARGLRGADCFHCHGGNLFSNHRFMNNGLVPQSGDLGRMETTKAESDRGKFKVPTLRNIALTAPYMHDGRFATLEEVVEHYNGKLHRAPNLDPNLAKHPEAGLGLSAEDKAALVAFLKTLTDETFSAPKPEVNQFSKLP